MYIIVGLARFDQTLQVNLQFNVLFCALAVKHIFDLINVTMEVGRFSEESDLLTKVDIC